MLFIGVWFYYEKLHLVIFGKDLTTRRSNQTTRSSRKQDKIRREKFQKDVDGYANSKRMLTEM